MSHLLVAGVQAEMVVATQHLLIAGVQAEMVPGSPNHLLIAGVQAEMVPSLVYSQWILSGGEWVPRVQRTVVDGAWV